MRGKIRDGLAWSFHATPVTSQSERQKLPTRCARTSDAHRLRDKGQIALPEWEKDMTPQYPPFMFGYGIISSIFAKIQAHDPPEIFSHDFLRFTLGFSRESDRAFIPLAKRTGFLTSEGKPTELYLRLRNPEQFAGAVAEAMKNGYSAFYASHADAHDLDRKVLAGIVTEMTGLAHGHASARAIVGTFLALKAAASPRVEVPRAGNRRKVPERRGG
jgi:hypothetical protein